MTLSKLDTLILNDVQDDYENVAWLAKSEHIQAAGGSNEGVIASRLRKLAEARLIDVFWYDIAEQTYIPMQFDSGKRDGELWFYATPAGRSAVTENWNEAWSDE